jgi:hypothetical protein
LIPLFGFMLLGCGGGPSSPQPVAGDGSFGAISFEGRLTSTPLVTEASEATVTSMTGDFTSVRVRYPSPAASNALVFFSIDGRNLLTMDGDGQRPQSVGAFPGSGRSTTGDYNPANNRLYLANGKWMDVYTGATGSYTPATDCSSVSVSPFGSRIAYTLYSAGANSLYTANADGTNVHLVRDLTSGAYEWTTEDKLLLPEGGYLRLYSYLGGTALVQTLNDNIILSISRSPDGSSCGFILVPNGETAPVIRVYSLDEYGWPSYGAGATYKQLNASAEPVAVQFTPDSREVLALAADASVTRYDALGNSIPLYTTLGHAYVPRFLSVTPFAIERKLVGATAASPGGAAGILLSQVRDKVTACVVADVDTRSSFTLTLQSAGSLSNVVYQLEGDNVNKLKFSTNALHKMVSAMPNSGTCNGAIVTFNASTGFVSSVLPYTETRGAVKVRAVGNGVVVTGEFNCVRDGSGRIVSDLAAEVKIEGDLVQIVR